MSLRDVLSSRLAEIEQQGLLRSRDPLEPASSADLVNVCSNDYLGQAAEHVSRETSAARGAGASRLIHGTRPEHRSLERDLAEWVGLESSLLFSSGYAANVGLLSALGREGDLIVSDELNHASLIDGCRLSRARVIVTKHRDLRAVEAALQEPARQKWVISESYFSMDGVTPDLRRLRALCDDHQAFLVLDEAHALGVFGPQGSGLCKDAGVVPDVLVGTLGKAVGVQGAFVAGPVELTDYLWNRARSFVFSTAVSPALVACIAPAVVGARLADASRMHLAVLASDLDAALRAAGIPLSRDRHGPIFPIILETPEHALTAVRRLRQRGFLAQAIRPPTVPAGTSRMRVVLNATLSRETVQALAEAIRDACSGS